MEYDILSDFVDYKIDKQIAGLDPRVVIDFYLNSHRDETQASLAKNVFHITPASFSKALSYGKDFLREDWRPRVRAMLESADIDVYMSKIAKLFVAKKLIELRDQIKRDPQLSATDRIKKIEDAWIAIKMLNDDESDIASFLKNAEI